MSTPARRPPPARLLRATREALALVRQGALMLRPPAFARPAHEHTGQDVVVFVHGFMANPQVFEPLGRFLQLQGHGRAFAFGYLPVGSVEQLSNRFSAWVDAMLPRSARLRIVGHSLGGVIARVFLQELGGHARVDTLVTIATPHDGTRSANLAPGRLAADMRPGSPLIERLRRGWSADMVSEATAIVAGADLMVTPPESAAALPGARVVWLHGVGHNESLFHSDAHLAVHGALRPSRR